MAYFAQNPMMGLLAFVALIVVGALVMAPMKSKKQLSKLIEAMEKSQQTNYAFKSVQALSRETGIPENRVAQLCASSSRCAQNPHDDQAWCVQ